MESQGSYLTPRLEHATAGDAMRPRVLTHAERAGELTAGEIASIDSSRSRPPTP